MGMEMRMGMGWRSDWDRDRAMDQGRTETRTD